jgi:4,5-dihydroxyphthalate decarboxylase
MTHATIVIGEHPHTAALRTGEVRPERIELELVEVEPTNRAFAPMLREGAYDISEIAITVFLQAVEVGKPVWLLPVVAVGGFHHGSLYVNPERGPLTPADLRGKRVAVRAYSQTTGLYVRGVLAEDHGVAAEDVTWVTTEGSHVAEYEDPPNVVRAEPGAKLTELLREGRVDAAILGPNQTQEPWCVPLLADPEAAARDWHVRHGLVPINHMVCVGPAIAGSPELTADLVDALRRSHDAAATPPGPAITFDRWRIESAIAFALGLAREQGLVTRDLDIPAMFAPTSAARA